MSLLVINSRNWKHVSSIVFMINSSNGIRLFWNLWNAASGNKNTVACPLFSPLINKGLCQSLCVWLPRCGILTASPCTAPNSWPQFMSLYPLLSPQTNKARCQINSSHTHSVSACTFTLPQTVRLPTYFHPPMHLPVGYLPTATCKPKLIPKLLTAITL
jgi:hypothetical protein